MQKYFVGLLAVVIAVSAVAFTTPANKKFANRFFRYTGAAGAEATLSNWQYMGTTNTESCSSHDQKSCVINLDEAVVTASGDTYVIDATKLSANTSTSSTTLPVVSSGVGVNQIPDANESIFLAIVNSQVQ